MHRHRHHQQQQENQQDKQSSTHEWPHSISAPTGFDYTPHSCSALSAAYVTCSVIKLARQAGGIWAGPWYVLAPPSAAQRVCAALHLCWRWRPAAAQCPGTQDSSAASAAPSQAPYPGDPEMATSAAGNADAARVHAGCYASNTGTLYLQATGKVMVLQATWFCNHADP